MCYTGFIMADVLTLFDEIPGTFLVTDKNGLLRYANNAVAQKTGFDVAQAIGQKAGQLWGKHMSRAFYGQLWETVREKEKPFIAEGINKTRLGVEMKEKWYIAPISDGADPLYLQIGLPFRADQRFDDAFATQLGHKRVTGDTLLWLYQHLGGKKNLPFFSDSHSSSRLK